MRLNRLVVFYCICALLLMPTKSFAFGSIFTLGNLASGAQTFFKEQMVESIKKKLLDEYQKWLEELKKNPGKVLRDAHEASRYFKAVAEGDITLADLVTDKISNETYKYLTGANAAVWSNPYFQTVGCLSKAVLGEDPAYYMQKQLEQLRKNILLGSAWGSTIWDVLNCFVLDYQNGGFLSKVFLEEGKDRDKPLSNDEIKEQAESSAKMLAGGKQIVNPNFFKNAVEKTAIVKKDGSKEMSDKSYEMLLQKQKIDYATTMALLANNVAIQGDVQRRNLAKVLEDMQANVLSSDILKDYTPEQAAKDAVKIQLLQLRVLLLILDQLQALNRLMAAQVSYDVDFRGNENLNSKVKEIYYNQGFDMGMGVTGTNGRAIRKEGNPFLKGIEE